MTLAAGTQLGPYEIVGVLGAGGMGEVYRARDSKLGRDVALKILPPLLATDADRHARFQREARVLASLNHPHIGAIYGLEESSDTPALVLELVEGPTLADRIACGPMPLDEALAIARQIADALEAAHAQGIIHRDLKPANIKVRPDGVVKVLDFGLAKAMDPAGSTPNLSQSPTASLGRTREGIILGTAAYMSPEQARGQAIDTRTDIWAFGCVLYEMLTGRAAFAGNTVSDVIAAILGREPDWQALPAAAIPLVGVLQRCLEKDAKRRLRDVGDVRLWLEDASTRSAATMSSAALPMTARRTSSIAAIAAAALLGILGGGAIVALVEPSRARPIPPRVARFEIAPSSADPFANTTGMNVAISPDGSRIVYTSNRGAVPDLVGRRLDRVEASPIAGAEGGFQPFFSPDGQQVGFVTTTELKRVPADGGTSVTICRVDPTFTGANWAPDNTIWFATSTGLFRVSATGGSPERFAALDTSKDEQYFGAPVPLPGGKAVLYSVVLRGGQTRIAARRLGGGDATPIVEGGFGPRYLPSGHLIFGSGDRVMAARFDTTTLHLAGAPVPVQEGVFTKAGDTVLNIASAADGTAVYVAGRDTGAAGRPVWVDRRGKHVARLVDQPLEFPRNPRLSPDGHRLALTTGASGLGTIWVYDLDRATQPVRLTFQGHNTFSIWSPDGKRIAFLRLAGSVASLLSIPSDGSAVQPDTETTDDVARAPLDWSRDGALILFQAQTAYLGLLHVSDRKATTWLQTPFVQYGARFSTDGRWVAYSTNQTGATEVWVRPFPGPGAPVRVSSEGGHDPVWGRDDKEIFYTNGPKMMSARILSSAPDFRVEAPRVVFEGGFAHDDTDFGLRFFDVAPDGRFLMLEPAGASSTASIIVAPHWDEDVKRLVP